MTPRSPASPVAAPEAVLLLPGEEVPAGVMTALCGGLTLVDRLLRQLKRAQVESVLVVERGGAKFSAAAGDRRGASRHWPQTVEVAQVAGTLTPAQALASFRDVLPARFLLLPANLLIDQRVLETLFAQPPVATLDLRDATCGVFDRQWLDQPNAASARRVQISACGSYHHELRRHVAPFARLISSMADLREGSDILVGHTQKGALDLPGQYFDTPFENLLLKALAPTRITPNQVTLATTVVGFAVAFLFWHGWLVSGALLGLLVGILDGVDGKLARIRLESSRLGELEHVGDFLYENAWYLGVASHLQALWLGCAMVAADLADNMAYLVVKRRHGKLLDEMSPFDRALRRVAGRRNVYVWIFLIGFALAERAATFKVAATWAALTSVTHWVRALWWLKRGSEEEGAWVARPARGAATAGGGNDRHLPWDRCGA